MKAMFAITGMMVLFSTVETPAKVYEKGGPLRLREYVGRAWENELIHYVIEFGKLARNAG